MCPFGSRFKGGTNAQCRNFRFFLSFRFYVKTMLENSAGLKLWFLGTLEALNFANLVNFRTSKKCKISKKSKFRTSICVKKDRFCISRMPKFDFT